MSPAAARRALVATAGPRSSQHSTARKELPSGRISASTWPIPRTMPFARLTSNPARSPLWLERFPNRKGAEATVALPPRVRWIGRMASASDQTARSTSAIPSIIACASCGEFFYSGVFSAAEHRECYSAECSGKQQVLHRVEQRTGNLLAGLREHQRMVVRDSRVIGRSAAAVELGRKSADQRDRHDRHPK